MSKEYAVAHKWDDSEDDMQPFTFYAEAVDWIEHHPENFTGDGADFIIYEREVSPWMDATPPAPIIKEAFDPTDKEGNA